MAKNEAVDTETQDSGDAPLIDLNDASIKKMIARAKKRGFITIDELNEALPQDQMASEQIEDIMSAINDMGINVVENEEASDDEEDKQEEDTTEDEVDPLDDGGPRPAAATKKEPTDRTDDPVRMYLREMGAVELLSREGEIAIAKRIEAGRDIMIWGLCESPMTFNAIIDWSNALNEGRMQLREIMDLEAMLSKGPTAEQIAQSEEGEEGGAEGEISEKTAGPSIKEEEEVADEPEAGTNEDDEDMVDRRDQAAGRRGRRRERPVARPDGGAAQAAGAGEVRNHHLALQEVLEAPGRAPRRARQRQRIPARRREEVPASSASSSRPRSRASSSTTPRSSSSSSSSTATTAA